MARTASGNIVIGTADASVTAKTASGQVQVTAGQLGVEQLQAAVAGQGRVRPDGTRETPTAERGLRCRCPQFQDGVREVLLGRVAAGRRVTHGSTVDGPGRGRVCHHPARAAGPAG